MNQEILAGKWNLIRDNVRKTWERLSDTDVEEIKGNYDILISKLQEKYGFTIQEATQEVDRFLEMVGEEEHFHL